MIQPDPPDHVFHSASVINANKSHDIVTFPPPKPNRAEPILEEHQPRPEEPEKATDRGESKDVVRVSAANMPGLSHAESLSQAQQVQPSF